MRGKDPTYFEMVHTYGEMVQTVRSRGMNLINDLGELATDLENLKDVSAWPGWQRGNAGGDPRDRERLADLKERLRRSSAEFDRSGEMLTQARVALAALIAK